MVDEQTLLQASRGWSGRHLLDLEDPSLPKPLWALLRTASCFKDAKDGEVCVSSSRRKCLQSLFEDSTRTRISFCWLPKLGANVVEFASKGSAFQRGSRLSISPKSRSPRC